MNALIGVPWRPMDPWRDLAQGYVTRHLERTGYPILHQDSDPAQPFSRAAARNQAVKAAAAAGCNVVILNDADMIAPVQAYPAMVRLALETGRLVIGYYEYRALTADASLAVVRGGADPWTAELAGTTQGWSIGGILAITPAAWAEVGGMDERFRGWGCEDTAFAVAAARILGPLERLATPAVHLWHPHGSDPHDPAQRANGELLARYNAAETVEQLRAVQGGR